jgi:hypothetical protein
VQFNALAGTTYQVAIDGFNYFDGSPARSGHITLAISLAPTVLAQWNFNSLLDDNNTATGTLSPAFGAGTVSYVGSATGAGAGEFAAGSTNDLNWTDNSGWNTSNYPQQGTSNKTSGVQFNVSTVGAERIVITWDQRVSNTGSKYVRLQYSTNGADFIDYPSATSMSSAVVFESKTNNLESIAAVNNNPNFAFRIVSEFESTAIGTTNANYVGAAGTYGSGGTMRFDRVTVSANRIAAGP